MSPTVSHMSAHVRIALILCGLIVLQAIAPLCNNSWINLSRGFCLSAPETPSQVWQHLCMVQSTVRLTVVKFAKLTAKHWAAIPRQPVISPPKKGKRYRIVSVSSVRSSEKKLSWPVSGGISSGFGMRRHPITRRRAFHYGIDIKASRGTPVKAPAGGVVVSCGRAGLMGRLVKVRTATGLMLYFGHLSKYKCHRGDRLKRGQVIGLVGASGRATGPHLHFSVKRHGRYLNPIRVLYSRHIH